MSKKFEFQISDWNTYHELDEEEEEKYVIQLFGRTADDKDVVLKVNGFTPFFYVEIPNNWTKTQVEKFVDTLKRKVSWRTSNDPKYDYDLGNSLLKYNIVQKYKYYGFTNKKLFKFVLLVFKSHTSMKEFSNILARPLKAEGLTKEPMLYQRYESNIEPHIRFMHINNISSCGWLEIDKSKLDSYPEYSYCDYSYQIDWHHVKPLLSGENKGMAPFKIMGYDIECISCDENFPQASRKTDKIIQIGITMYRYGSMECYEQHMLVLGDCAQIKGANVECYKTERGLIRGFAEKFREIRPDFMAGYNNFGFDDKYIYDRIGRIDKVNAEKQGVSVENMNDRFLDEILQIMGKVNNRFIMEDEGLRSSLTHFEVKNLSSSALGDNELKFFQIPGIISIDMMKVIQRDHRLDGYKLDNVSANFIKENVIKIIETDKENENNQIPVNIYTRSTQALEKKSYIQIMINDGYSSSPMSEGAKYRVLDIETVVEKEKKDDKTIETKYQVIKTEINTIDINELRDAMKNKNYKVFWTFAKDDMHHTLINKYFKEGDPKNIRQIAVYCLKDCKLVNLLLEKLKIIVNSTGMATVCHVPLSYLFLRGQGVKIFSLVSKKCRQRNFLIPVLQKKKKDISGNEEEETYEGAIVITPIPGVYFSPIGVLDFSSLYPNSMRERNLSHECYVDNKRYDNLEGYIYHDIYIPRKDKDGKVITDTNGNPVTDHHRFAQEIVTDEQIETEMKLIFDGIRNNPDLSEEDKKKKMQAEKSKVYNFAKGFTVKYGILPEILTELLNSRKETRIRQDSEKDPFMWAILESLQLAYKITANSLYGQTGAPTSPIYFLPIAASTTATGRERLYFAKDTVEENFKGSEIVYGDSVTSDTPLILKDEDDNIIIKSISELGQEWIPYEEFKPEDSNRKYKQQTPVKYKIWTVHGWSNIRRVIRHKTNKKIYRVCTKTGCVDVTEDHSLLDANGKIIKPTECHIGTELMHGFMDETNVPNVDTASAKGAQYRGYDFYQNNPEFENLLVPDWILNGDNGVKRGFLMGYFFDPHGRIKEYNLTGIKSKIRAQIIYFLSKMLGKELHIRATEKGTYDLIPQGNFFYGLEKKWRRIPSCECPDKLIGCKCIDPKSMPDSTTKEIISIQYLRDSDNEFVYDLETESGTFHAGIGEMIVKNTDSIFINFHIQDEEGNDRVDEEALLQTMEYSRQAATIINGKVPKPQSIVYEKTLHPLILVAKKKYVGLLFENDPKKYFLKSMGIVLKRRDNAPIVKIVVGGIIDNLLKKRDLNGAIEYSKEVLDKLMLGGYPMDKFVISKTLKSKYKKPLTIAHKVLADRMAIRDPGNKPQVNDRIPFVYIVKDMGKKKKKDILQGDLVEHPDYVVEKGLKIDYLYYLEHQIINPATQILELLIPTKQVEKFFNKYSIEEQGHRIGRQSMEKWMGEYEVPEQKIISKKDTKNIKRDRNPTLLSKGKKATKQKLDKWFKDSPKVNSDDWEPKIL